MKLAIVIVLLAFCFCESYANVSRCKCSPPGELDRQYAGLVEYFQPSSISAKRYEGRDGFPDLDVSVSKNDNIELETRKPAFRLGMGNLPTPRRRTLRDQPYLRSSRESFGEPEYTSGDSTYGDYNTQG